MKLRRVKSLALSEWFLYLVPVLGHVTLYRNAYQDAYNRNRLDNYFTHAELVTYAKSRALDETSCVIVTQTTILAVCIPTVAFVLKWF